LFPEKAAEIVRELGNVPIDFISTVALVSSALTIALQVRRSVYDSVYLAHAIRSGAALLTGDRKFFDVIKAGPLAAHIEWIGALAAPPTTVET
jgi:predicted nucleic acid-binding protein